MPSTIEQRITELETKVSHLIKENKKTLKEESWWERHVGAFKNSPAFEDAMRLGEEYRKSQPTRILRRCPV